MKQTYISPIMNVDEAEMDGHIMVPMSIQLSDEGGSEEYTKEDLDDDWDPDW